MHIYSSKMFQTWHWSASQSHSDTKEFGKLNLDKTHSPTFVVAGMIWNIVNILRCIIGFKVFTA